MRAYAYRLCAAAAACISIAAHSAEGEDITYFVEKVEPAIVRIDVDGALGSGVVIDAKGIVATNYHVIRGTTKAKVTFRDKSTLKALGYLAIEPHHDLAVLKLEDTKRELAHIPLAKALPRKGEKVAAFGAPEGLSFSASEGIISAIRNGNEVKQMDPRIRFLGYSDDATWLQTTAAISHGNSGGPLINMAGEIVGLNTWFKPEGNSLNFAISMTDLAGLLAKASSTVSTFDTLPRETVTISSSSTEPVHRIRFPSGKVLTSEMMKIDRRSLVNSDESLVVALSSYASGRPRAMVTHREGQLQGTAFALSESHDPEAYATYDKGRKHGVVVCWREEGKPLLWAQYEKGIRHGIFCMMDDDVSGMAIEYNHEHVDAIHLFTGWSVTKSFKGKPEAQSDDQAKSLLVKLHDVELRVAKSDLAFRKQAAEDALRIKRARNAAMAPEKKAARDQRRAQRAAEQEQYLNALRRWSGL